MKTLVDFIRPELEFKIINDKGESYNNKYKELHNLLNNKNRDEDIFSLNG